MFDNQSHHSERVVADASGTGSRGPRVGGLPRLVPGPGPMTSEEREAWLDHLAETDEPPEAEDGETSPRSSRGAGGDPACRY
jgi:hypothetical protein